jgi:ribosome-binding factor A
MKESNRQKKFGKLIQKELSDVLQRDVQVEGNPMLTVTVVRGTPDLKIARIYISVFPDEKGPAALAELQTRMREVRHILGGRLRHQLRDIPEIQFYLDDTMQAVAHMDRLFGGLKPAREEEE